MVKPTSKFHTSLLSSFTVKNWCLFFPFPRLYNPAFNGVYAPAIGTGVYGISGQITYPHVCKFLAAGATRHFDLQSRVPYAYLQRNWISYDDEDSLEEKVNRILKGNYT